VYAICSSASHHRCCQCDPVGYRRTASRGRAPACVLPAAAARQFRAVPRRTAGLRDLCSAAGWASKLHRSPPSPPLVCIPAPSPVCARIIIAGARLGVIADRANATAISYPEPPEDDQKSANSSRNLCIGSILPVVLTWALTRQCSAGSVAADGRWRVLFSRWQGPLTERSISLVSTWLTPKLYTWASALQDAGQF
jgi:hypothetical protein